MARSSEKTVVSVRPRASRTSERYQTQGLLWSGETRSISAGSTTPVRRISPTASELIVEPGVSAMRAAVR